MTATLATPKAETKADETFVLSDLSWEQYLTIGGALAERAGLRMIYLDGSLMLLTKSHGHEWLAEFFGYAVVAVAIGCEIDCEAAGGTTFRRKDQGAGAEGDKTFYFGDNAEKVRGRAEIDLSIQPPPDLAIEVEVSNPADAAMVVWGRLGVPEVWRFDEARLTLSFWARRPDGSYGQESRSRFLPMFEARELVDQIPVVEELGLTRGFVRIADWSREVLRPRLPDRP